eukprot:g16854.t1
MHWRLLGCRLPAALPPCPAIHAPCTRYMLYLPIATCPSSWFFLHWLSTAANPSQCPTAQRHKGRLDWSTRPEKMRPNVLKLWTGKVYIKETRRKWDLPPGPDELFCIFHGSIDLRPLAVERNLDGKH